MSDGLQQRLDKGMYGAPKVNPDEQRNYLGTFRERCYLQMTLDQMKSETLKKLFQAHLTDFPDATCLLNGVVSETLQTTYIGILAKSDIEFTIVSSEKETTDNAIGLLLVAKEAVNTEVIDIAEKYGTTSSSTNSEEKSSFFAKFFG